jgi:hypothetical protein
MNKIILAPCDFISKIKQNSSDMNEIILASCDAGYVQNCTGLIMIFIFLNKCGLFQKSDPNPQCWTSHLVHKSGQNPNLFHKYTPFLKYRS